MCFLIFFNDACVFLVCLDIRIWAIRFNVIIHIIIIFRQLYSISMVPNFNGFLNT